MGSSTHGSHPYAATRFHHSSFVTMAPPSTVISTAAKFGVEFLELPRDVHPYYVSTQAHPELRSRPTRPHPLFAGLVGAALARQRELRIPIDETGLRRVSADDE